MSAPGRAYIKQSTHPSSHHANNSRAVWDPRAKSAVADAVAVPNLDPARAARAALDEYELYKQVKRTRSELTRIASAAGARSSDSSKAPLLLFERWVARASLAPNGLAAPLLPNVDFEGGLMRDFVRHGASEKDGERAAEDAVSRAREAAARWLRRREGFTTEEKATETRILVRERGAFITLQLGSLKPYVKVTKVHLGKLRALYCRRMRRGKPLPGDMGSIEYQTFAFAVYALLLRYESLGGAGYQAALGEDAFDILHEKLGVTVECFASPLNCRYGAFCSQFIDVDGYFGSLGSFFAASFEPLEGSFEVNPPFVPETMLLAVEKVESLLARAERECAALSFVIIVPAWTDCKFWAALLASVFLICDHDVVKAQDHGFCDGSQHARPSHERHRVSSYDTGVWYLQTRKAAQQWVVTDSVRGLVIEKMRNALGTVKNVQELEKRYRPDNSLQSKKKSKIM